jgi:U3 small nucleolar RNA-associated protein 6
LDRLKETTATVKDKAELSKKIKVWFERILSFEDLDPGIQTVVGHTLRRLE